MRIRRCVSAPVMSEDGHLSLKFDLGELKYKSNFGKAAIFRFKTKSVYFIF